MFPLITTFAPLFYKNKKWNYTRSKPVSNLSFLRIIFFNSIRKSRYVLKETLFPPTLYSPSLSQCGLAWVPPPPLHSGNMPLQQSAGTSRLVTDILAGELSLMGATGADMTMKPISTSDWTNQLGPSAVWFCHCVCFFCLSAFSLASRWQVEMWRRGSPSLPVEWSVCRWCL